MHLVTRPTNRPSLSASLLADGGKTLLPLGPPRQLLLLRLEQELG